MKIFMYILLLTMLPLYGHIDLVEEDSVQEIEETFLTFKAAYQHTSGNTSAAEESYQQLAKLQPHNTSVTLAQARLSFDQGRHAQGITHAQAIINNLPEHKELALQLAQAYVVTHNISDALTLLEKLRTLFPHDDKIAYHQIVILIKEKKYEKARTILKAVLSNKIHEGKHYLFHFLLAKLEFLTGNLAIAQHHIEKCLSLSGQFVQALLLKGIIYEQAQMNTPALAAYIAYTTHTRDIQIEQKIITFAFDTGNHHVALEYLQKNPQNTADYYHDKALLLFKTGQTSAAHDTLAKALQLEKKHAKSHILLTHLFLKDKNYSAAASTLKQWIEYDPYNTSPLQTLCKLEQRDVPHTLILDTLAALAHSTRTYTCCFAYADQLHKEAQYVHAHKWYTTALADSALTQNGLVASQLHYQIAVTLFQQEQWSECMKALQESLLCRPVYPSSYNLFATLLLRKQHYEQAHKAIEKALFAQPEYAPYLDTQGMIYAAQGKKTHAYTLFKKAHTLAPDDTTIASHLTSVS